MSIPGHQHIEKDGFRLRGTEMSRVDGFSDVVFGFALTLLVLSLEVPKTYTELHEKLGGIFAFAISFFFLMLIWWAHFKFFRRYGLHDTGTIALNAMLLFVVLFYVYPLKFLFSFLTLGIFSQGGDYFKNPEELRQLMILYGVGFAAIYFLFTALYWNARRQQDALELNLVERTLAKLYIFEVAGPALVGVLACVLAAVVPIHYVGLTGWTYLLLWPYGMIQGRISRRRTAAAKLKMEPPVAPAESLEST